MSSVSLVKNIIAVSLFFSTFVFSKTGVEPQASHSFGSEQRLVYVTELQQLSESQRMAIINDKAELTNYDRYIAKEFRLTEDDMKKYKKVMLGKRGIWSPGLDPISALGVEETDNQERLRYAKLWLEVEGKRVDLQFKFERAVASMRTEVFGSQHPFDTSDRIAHIEKQRRKPVAIIDVLVSSNCRTDCEIKINDIIKSRGRSVLNFFFIDSTTPQKINDWAEHHKLDTTLVNKKIITLNYGQAKLRELGMTVDDVDMVHIELTKLEYEKYQP